MTGKHSETASPTADEVAKPKDRLAVCRLGGHYITHVECWNCGGEGFSHHDCGEDCCFCLQPEDNVVCDICEGEGGYLVCLTCHPDAADDY